MTEAVSAPQADAGRWALLVVDVQKAAVALGPYREGELLENLARLIATARDAGMDVIHVQHDGETGGDFEPGSSGWEFHSSVAPRPGETIVRKRFNSAFRGTDLLDVLESRSIRTLVLVGLQTEYCIDTTCRVAFEHGFEIVMPEMTNSTYDNDLFTGREIYEYHNRRIFEGRFATRGPLAEALHQIELQAATGPGSRSTHEVP